jgi:hypothetical protein
MKYVILLLLVGAFAGVSLTQVFFTQACFAQVSSSAFDPQCYQPTVGDPGVIDTIYGSRNMQGLGGGLFNVGPRYGESDGRIITDGLQKDTINYSSIRTGPTFNIHKLQVEKNMNFSQDKHPIFGHFHSPHLTDLLIRNHIYWSDDSGNYDESRSSFLWFTPHGASNNGPDANYHPYAAYLSSDSLEDIVTTCTSSWQKARPDTGYIMYFKGSKSLPSVGEFVYPDTELAAPYLDGNGNRGFIAGDFRGSGKQDCIAYDDLGNFYYYKNEGSFSLQKFTNAIQFDTLYSRSDNPKMKPRLNPWSMGFPLKAFAKASWDKSLDFFGSVLTTDDQNGAQLFFRGGKDFGSKRLFLDSVDFVMHSPRYLDNGWSSNLTWGDEIWNCGDMTGTGNTVICAHGSDDGDFTNFYFFYVLGRAMDEKVDMYYSMSNSDIGAIDTLVADRDSLQDIINGLGGFTSGDDRLLHNWWFVGTLQLIHGSTQIPVHISPKYGVALSHNAPSGLSAFPNPIRNHFQIDFTFRSSGETTVRFSDLLGREVYREIFRGAAGEQIKRIQLPKLANGVYQLSIERGPEQLRTKIVVTQ